MANVLQEMYLQEKNDLKNDFYKTIDIKFYLLYNKNVRDKQFYIRKRCKMRFLKQLKERMECKKLAKDFERIKNLRLEQNKNNTENYIAGEYVMYCISNNLPVNDVDNVVKYSFNEGIKKGMIDKYTLTVITDEN